MKRRYPWYQRLLTALVFAIAAWCLPFGPVPTVAVFLTIYTCYRGIDSAFSAIIMIDEWQRRMRAMATRYILGLLSQHAYPLLIANYFVALALAGFGISFYQTILADPLFWYDLISAFFAIITVGRWQWTTPDRPVEKRPLRDRILDQMPQRVHPLLLLCIVLTSFGISVALYRAAWLLLTVPLLNQPWFVFLDVILGPVCLALCAAFFKGCTRYWGRYRGQEDAWHLYAGAILRDMVSSVLSNWFNSWVQTAFITVTVSSTPVMGDIFTSLYSGWRNNYLGELEDLGEQERAMLEFLDPAEQAAFLPKEGSWEVLALYYVTGVAAQGTILVGLGTIIAYILGNAAPQALQGLASYILGPGRWFRPIIPLAFLRLGLEAAWLRSRLRKPEEASVRRDAVVVMWGMINKGPIVFLGGYLSTLFSDQFSFQYRLEETHPLVSALSGKLIRDQLGRCWRLGSRITGQFVDELAWRWRETRARNTQGDGSRSVQQFLTFLLATLLSVLVVALLWVGVAILVMLAVFWAPAIFARGLVLSQRIVGAIFFSLTDQ